MGQDVKNLIENLKTTYDKIRENALINKSISELKCEYSEKFNSKSKEIKKGFLNKLSEYDSKINEIQHYCNEQIAAIKDQNLRLKNRADKFKNDLIKGKTKNINGKIENIKYRKNMLEIEKDDILKKRNNKWLSYTVLPHNIFQWIVSIIVVIIGFGEVITQMLGLLDSALQWLIIIGLVAVLIYFNRKYKNKLNYIDPELGRLEDSLQTLVKEKESIISKIDEEPFVIQIVDKINVSNNNVNKFIKEKDNQIDKVKKEKSRKNDELNLECDRKINKIRTDLDLELNRKISNLKSKYKDNIFFLKNESEVTDEYQREDILSRVISYLKNGRASNKKEAINLYEDEKRKDLEFKIMNDRNREVLELEKRKHEDQVEFNRKQLEKYEEKYKKELELENRKIDEQTRLKIKEIESQKEFNSQSLELEKEKMRQQQNIENQRILAESIKFKTEVALKIKAIRDMEQIFNLDEKQETSRMKHIIQEIDRLDKGFKEKVYDLNEYEFEMQKLRNAFREENNRLKITS